MPVPAAKRTLSAAVCMLALVPICGCGAGGGVDNTPAVLSFAPEPVDSEIAAPYTVRGRGFGPVGSPATVRLQADAGTPFLGGTSAFLDLAATIVSSTVAQGTTTACGVTGATQATVSLIVPDTPTLTSAGALATVQGPTLAALSQEVFVVSGTPEDVVLEGAGFGPVGSRATLRMTATLGRPFLGGTSQTLDLPGTIDSDTAFRFVMPGSVATESASAEVELLYVSGASAEFDGPIVTFWLPIKLKPADGEAGDEFGHDIAVSGNTLVVSARRDDDKAAFAGSVYVYVRNGGTWGVQQKLIPGDGVASDYFGAGVAISGDTLAVGNMPLGAGLESVYVYARSGTTWTLQQKLYPSGASASRGFGTRVAMEGDTIVVGAASDDSQAQNSGAAYVFVKTGAIWSEEQKLLASDGGAFFKFGSSVDIHGDTILVGAPRSGPLLNPPGAGYAFVRTGSVWTEEQRLVAPDAVANDATGNSVGLWGDWAVLGAELGDGVVSNSGTAYVFERSAGVWTHKQELAAPDGAYIDSFGVSVAIRGTTVLVGARADDAKGGLAGSAYVFRRQGTAWTLHKKLLAPDGQADDWFGWSVALGNVRAFVAAQKDDDNGGNSGSVWVH